MVEAPEIDGPEKLQEWLEGLPASVGEERARQIAVTIAFRAAARVFPLAVRGMPAENKADINGDLTSLTLYRCLSLSSFAAPTPIEDIAVFASGSAFAAASEFVPSALASAAFASYAAARAVAYDGYLAYARDALADSALAYADVVANAADAAALERGEALEAVPLWPDTNPLSDVWAEARQKLEAAPDDWSPVIAWYEHLLDPKGRALRVEMLREIALGRDSVTGNEIDWAGGPPKALPVIGEIWGRYHRPTPSAIELMDHALVQFKLDEFENVFRAVPFPNDWRKLSDPDALSAFLEDAEDLRESFDTLFKMMQGIGVHSHNAAGLCPVVENICSELNGAADVEELQVGKLLEWSRILENNLSDSLLEELGVAGGHYKDVVERMRSLLRKHFAALFVRLGELHAVRLEEGVKPEAVLHVIRDLIERARSGHAGLTPMAEEDAAVLTDMMESVDRTLLRASLSTDADLAESAAEDADRSMARGLATLESYRVSAMRLWRRSDDAADLAIKYGTKGEKLFSLAKKVWDAFPSGGG